MSSIPTVTNFLGVITALTVPHNFYGMGVCLKNVKKGTVYSDFQPLVQEERQTPQSLEEWLLIWLKG